MSLIKKGIPPEDFYGKKNALQDKIEAILKKQQTAENFETPKFINRLLGPSETWKVFKKQQDAIECCLRRRSGLMPFAFEDINGRRMFLVSHPEVFWNRNFGRFFKNCNTYEIIQEFSACKLYLDIEYEYEYNPACDGDRMVNNMLKIINFNLYEVFKIKVSINDILNLDSSNDIKFSRHVIYEIKNIAFQNNYSVGSFVKKICCELKEAFETNSFGDDKKLTELSKKYGLRKIDILELFIYNNKKKHKLFVDEGVYTKNRHFRILGSSKLAKNTPFIISKSNKYEPKKSVDSYDCQLFLDSLVTYFTWTVNRVLKFEESRKLKRAIHVLNEQIDKQKERTESCVYPQIDLFIRNLISPNGIIRRKVFFCDSSTLMYDIQGFRYCDHIKREHKSNNIKYIVDLKCLGFYQKCYDPDCQDFRSVIKPLPDDIRFFFEDDVFFKDDSSEKFFYEFLDEKLIKTAEKIKNENDLEENLIDDELIKIVDCTEAMLDVNW